MIQHESACLDTAFGQTQHTGGPAGTLIGGRFEGFSDGAAEHVLTVRQLSQQLSVSTKTISRWRQQGLASGRFVFRGRERVGFLQSAVDRFVQQNGELVRRGAGFSRLTDDQKQQLVDRARRLARAGGGPAEVTKRLARKAGRSAETVRYVLKQFDRDHPDQAVFPDHHGPVREQTKQKIYDLYRRGKSVDALAKRFCQAKTRVRHIVKEMRVRHIMELPLDYVANDEFPRVRSEEAILADAPQNDPRPTRNRLPSGIPSYLASLYEVPLLSRPQEMHLFRKMNYLKYKAAKLREQLDPLRPSAALMDQIEELHNASIATKNEITRANLRLVVSIIKRHMGPSDDFFELVSEGNLTLMRAVEKFDFARGNKFGTYASWAIRRTLARSIPNEYRHRNRYRTGHDEALVTAEDVRSDPSDRQSCELERKGQVEEILDRLDPRERNVIVHRFGLLSGHEPLTLKEVGAMMGVTKERVRQIEARAINKLQEAARKERIEVAGI